MSAARRLVASASSSSSSALLVESIRAKHCLPALSFAVAKDGRIVDRAAVGVRKLGDEAQVTTDDRFHSTMMLGAVSAVAAIATVVLFGFAFFFPSIEFFLLLLSAQVQPNGFIFYIDRVCLLNLTHVSTILVFVYALRSPHPSLSPSRNI